MHLIIGRSNAKNIFFMSINLYVLVWLISRNILYRLVSAFPIPPNLGVIANNMFFVDLFCRSSDKRRRQYLNFGSCRLKYKVFYKKKKIFALFKIRIPLKMFASMGTFLNVVNVENFHSFVMNVKH